MKHAYLALTIPLILGSQLASANPQGGQVVHGTASFSTPNANVLNVTNSHNAVIQWQNFSIGSGQTTNFIQPSAASSVLNRVVGNNPSQILGNLNSNGKVFLINQHGLLVGEGAHINTAGFFGSTLNITDADFLNGKLKFAGGGLGGINNQGYIHAGEDGNIVLIAPNIENGGVIEVENGNIILAAGESITITNLQNSSIEYQVSSPENSITNLGQIIANEGAASLFAGSLKHSGSIRATGLVQDADGTIRLVATAKTEVSGRVDASGEQGGKIEILGEVVDVQSGAVVDASGSSAGGEILIGGDQQGLNPDVQNATSTTIAAGAEVHADATDSGKGGKVIVFAENDVHVHGELTARGGENGGDGGFIETSGLQVLDITSIPDASAAIGNNGEWLIDPFDITIVAGVGANDPLNFGAPFTSSVDGTILGVNLIRDALDLGTNVTIITGPAQGTGGTGAGNISLNASLNVTGTTPGIFQLSALNDIIINADIISSSPMNVILNANFDGSGGGGIQLNNTTIDTGVSTATAPLTMAGNFIDVTGTVSIVKEQGSLFISAPLTINNGASLSIGSGLAAGSTLTISGSDIVNNGTFISNGGCTDGCGTIAITNTFTNNGIFRQPTGISLFDGVFRNAGTGRIEILDANANNGSGIFVGSSIAGLLEFNTGSSVTGISGGVLSIDGLGTLNVLGPSTMAPPLFLELFEGTINNAQNLTIPNTFNWAGGSISGTGDFITPLSSTVNIVGGSTTNASVNGQDAQNRLNWINQGFIDLTGIGANNGLILNDSTIVNENQFYISAGSNTTLEISDNGNGGVVNDLDSLFGIGIAAGIDVTMTTPFTNAGTLFIEFPSDTLRLVDQDLSLENGALLMGEGRLVLEDSLAPVQQNQIGTLFVNNGGGIAPGVNDEGTINILGNLVLNPGSSLIFDIESASQHDRINVASNATGNGTVTINSTELYVLWDGPAGSGGFANVANNASASAGTFPGFISCTIPGCMSAQSASNVNIHEPLNVGNVVASSMLLTPATSVTLDFVMGDKSGSVFEWTGGGGVDNNWTNGANWLGGVTGDIPGVGANAGATVIIDGASSIGLPGLLEQVNVTGVTIDIAALQTDAHIILGTGGSLSLAGESYIATTYVLDNPATGLDFNGVGATLTGTGLLHTLPGTYQTFIDGSPVTINQWNQSGVFSLESAIGTDLVFDGTTFDNSGVFEIEPVSTGNVRLLTTGAFDNSGVIISEADVLMQLTSHALTGKISVELGTFSLLQDLTLGGIANIASGAVFSLVSPADLSLVSTSSLSGQGTLEIPNGTSLNLSPGAVVDPLLTLSLNGGSINQAENLSMPNTFNWFSGTVSVSGQAQTDFTISGGQTMTLFGTGDMTFNGGMQNDGIVDFQSAGGDFVLNGALLNNGLFLLNPTGVDADLSGLGTGVLTNSSTGSILKNTAFDSKVSWNITQNGVLDIADGGFIYEGIMDVTGSTIQNNIDVTNGAEFIIAPGGNVRMNPGSSLTSSDDSGLLTVDNTGLLNLSLGGKDLSRFVTLTVSGGLIQGIENTLLPGNIFIDGGGIFTGAGNVNIPAGAVVTAGNFSFTGQDLNNILTVTNQGSLDVLSGQTLGLFFADLQLPAPGTLSGAGAIFIPANSSLTAGDSSVTVANIGLNGRLTANTLTYGGILNWQSGTVSGSGLTTTGLVNLTTGTLDTNWTISPTGTVQWIGTSNDVLTINNATITNQGRFRITNFVDINLQNLNDSNVAGKDFSGSTAASFINQGLLEIDSDTSSGGVDPIIFDLAFDNDGGTIAILSGIFSLGVDSLGNIIALELDQATDVLQGFGIFEGDVINTAGLVTPGINNNAANNFQTGTLTIDGNFTQSGTGSLVFDLDSTLSGLLHDSLTVSGQLNAGGRVAFNIINNRSVLEIAALLDQSFSPLSFGTLAGRFDSVVVPPGLNFEFSDTGVITITSTNTDLVRISNELEVLFNKDNLNYGEMVKAMRFVDRKVRLALNDEDEEEERRAPRLVCK